jgi:outer membrane receptor for ferric coprogen and ferric-rhodotorulic acid
MKPTKLSIAILLSLLASQNHALAAENNDQKVSLPTLSVEGSNTGVISSEETGEYKIENSRAATKLNLAVKDTPQSITVLTRQVLDDFGIDTLNDAVELTPALTVERTETDRTYYTSRGFSITNFQVDGLAIPTAFDYPLIQGDIDTVVFDRLETLRGANGLLTGTGNPAATVNYVRKRPTDEFKASAKGSLGSWQRYRGEADVSGSLNENGTIRGRMIAAYEDKESYLDRYEKQREVFYGVLDFQLNDDNVLTVGHTYQKDDPKANLWGSLPLAYSNGQHVNYDTSNSSAQDWAYWINKVNNTFVELTSDLGSGWQATTQFTRIHSTSDSELFYLSGAPNQATDAIGYFAGKYYGEKTNYVADAYASGPFELAGREHELVVGVEWAKADEENKQAPGKDSTTTLSNALSNNIDRPDLGELADAGDTNAKQRSIYTSAKFNVSDKLNLIAGARYLDYDIESDAYATYNKGQANEWIPYLGTVYSLTNTLNAYASFTQIFQPQSKYDRNLKLLDPAEGQTFEIGLKNEFNNGKALASLALFKTEQNNLAEADIKIGALQTYKGIDVKSKGIELDLMGEVSPGLQVIGGYTYVDVEDKDGNHAKVYIPRNIFKLATTYQLQSDPKWKLGANVRWQSSFENANVDVEQGAYSVWGANASYQVTPKLTAQLNLYNIFDKKYFNSFYDNGDAQAYYAAPRSAVVAAKYNF